MGERPNLSVVVPFFDERDNLAPLHAEIVAAVGSVAGGIEVVYVDDGSRDDGPDLLRELARGDPRIRVIRMRRNSGQSAALEAGFQAARGEWIATLDADRQNDPADLPRLLARLDEGGGVDVVNGVRADRHDTALRILSSRIANAFRNALTGESVTDVGCSLRVMRARYARAVRLWRGAHRFLPTLLRMQGARVAEIPVTHRPRTAGVSKYGLGNRLFVGLADVFGVRWLQARHVAYEAHEETPAARDPAAAPEPDVSPPSA